MNRAARPPPWLLWGAFLLCVSPLSAQDYRQLIVAKGEADDIGGWLRRAASPLQAAEGRLRPYTPRDRALGRNLIDGIIAAREVLGELLGRDDLGPRDASRIHDCLRQSSRAEVLLLNLIERDQLPPTERRVALALLHESQRALSEASFLAHGLKLKVFCSAGERDGLPEYVTVSLANEGRTKALGATRLLVIGPEGVVAMPRKEWAFPEVELGGAVAASFDLRRPGDEPIAKPELEIHVTYYSYRSKASLMRRCPLG